MQSAAKWRVQSLGNSLSIQGVSNVMACASILDIDRRENTSILIFTIMSIIEKAHGSLLFELGSGIFCSRLSLSHSMQ